MKQIKISNSVQKQLALFKIDWDKRSYDEVIQKLILIRGDMK